MRIAATIARQTARKRAQPATPSPSVRDHVSHEHTASPARTARTKRKRRRNEADLPVTGVGQAGLTPLNLRYDIISLYLYI